MFGEQTEGLAICGDCGGEIDAGTGILAFGFAGFEFYAQSCGQVRFPHAKGFLEESTRFLCQTGALLGRRKLDARRLDPDSRGIQSGDRIAKVSVVGVGMRSHAGIASTMFRTLAEEGINIEMISTSEIKISVVIDEKYTELAVRVLHKAFGLDQPA